MANPENLESELSESYAFFIGDAFVSFDDKESKKLVAPFRVNRNLTDAQQDIADYKALISYLASQVGIGFSIQSSNHGFDCVFDLEENDTAHNFLLRVMNEIEGSSKAIKESFLTGVYDGRGSIDTDDEKINTIVVDLPIDKNLTETVSERITSIGNSIGYEFMSVNPQRPRIGKPRNAQLRLRASSARKYISELGFYSPNTIRRACAISELSDKTMRKRNSMIPVSPVIFSEKRNEEGSAGNPLVQMIQDVSLEKAAEENDYVALISSLGQEDSLTDPIVDHPETKSEIRIIPGCRSTYPRDANVALRAIKAAGHKCERKGCERQLFAREKDKMPYVEPHHLIPLSCNGDFDNTLDTEANIVALCSSCHNEIHYGKNRSDIIKELYDERLDRLKNAGIEVTIDELLWYYNLKKD